MSQTTETLGAEGIEAIAPEELFPKCVANAPLCGQVPPPRNGAPRRHGTYSAYTGGCRCADCHAAMSEYKRRYRSGERVVYPGAERRGGCGKPVGYPAHAVTGDGPAVLYHPECCPCAS